MYSPYGSVLCCRDTAACGRRQLTASDPALFLDEERRATPTAAAAAPAGEVCAVCGAPGDLYNRGVGFFHRDRALCEREQAYDLAPQTPDDWDPSLEVTAAMMRAAQAAAPPEVGPAPVPLQPAELAALAASNDLGRKTVAADGALEARMRAAVRR
jgi:hypothetical protein